MKSSCIAPRRLLLAAPRPERQHFSSASSPPLPRPRCLQTLPHPSPPPEILGHDRQQRPSPKPTPGLTLFPALVGTCTAHLLTAFQMMQALHSSCFSLKTTGQMQWRCPLSPTLAPPSPSPSFPSPPSPLQSSEQRVLRNDRAETRRERNILLSPLPQRGSQEFSPTPASPTREQVVSADAAVPPSMMFRFEQRYGTVYARKHINALQGSLTVPDSDKVISDFIKDVTEPKFSVLPASHGTSFDAKPSPPPSPPSQSPLCAPQRLKWTLELHESFVCAVESIGIEKGLSVSPFLSFRSRGVWRRADGGRGKKAKPKAILKRMKTNEVTRGQVSSHLQVCPSSLLDLCSLLCSLDLFCSVLCFLFCCFPFSHACCQLYRSIKAKEALSVKESSRPSSPVPAQPVFILPAPPLPETFSPSPVSVDQPPSPVSKHSLHFLLS